MSTLDLGQVQNAVSLKKYTRLHARSLSTKMAEVAAGRKKGKLPPIAGVSAKFRFAKMRLSRPLPKMSDRNRPAAGPSYPVPKIRPRLLRRFSVLARRDEGASPQWGCDRGATKPEPKSDATLRAAVLFGPDVVAHSLQTPEGYARRSRLVWAKNPSPQTWPYLWNGVLRTNRRVERADRNGVIPARSERSSQENLKPRRWQT